MDGWLVGSYDCFLLGWPLFRGELLVSGRATLLKRGLTITMIMNWSPYPTPKRVSQKCTGFIARPYLRESLMVDKPIISGGGFVRVG